MRPELAAMDDEALDDGEPGFAAKLATLYADSDYAEALRPLIDYDVLKYTQAKVLATCLVEVGSRHLFGFSEKQHSYPWASAPVKLWLHCVYPSGCSDPGVLSPRVQAVYCARPDSGWAPAAAHPYPPALQQLTAPLYGDNGQPLLAPAPFLGYATAQALYEACLRVIIRPGFVLFCFSLLH